MDIIETSFDFIQEKRKMLEFQELSPTPIIRQTWLFKNKLPGFKEGRRPVRMKMRIEVTYEDEVR